MRVYNFLFFLIIVIAQNVGYGQDIVKKPCISLDKEIHDYGTIEYGANGISEFVVSNTGTAPLIIECVKSSCGCLAPSWPTEPIMPGKTAKIKLKYDTHRVGAFNKSVTVMCNDPNRPVFVLIVKGTVVPTPPPVENSVAPANN